MAYTLQTFAETAEPETEKLPNSPWPKWALAGLILLVATGIWAARYSTHHEREEIVIPHGT